MFRDPAGQYEFEIPPGWGYDPDRSHLITVHFTRWDRPEERLSVRATPAFARGDAPLEDWYSALRGHVFPEDVREIAPVRLGHRAGALADARREGTHRRFLVVRGVRQDAIIEHSTPEPSTEERLSHAIQTVGSTIEVHTNRSLPVFVEAEPVYDLLLKAREAVNREAWAEVLDPAIRAFRSAESTYLYSLISNQMLPEVPAVTAMVEALIYQGQAAASISRLRSAEHLAERALYTLRHLPFPPHSAARWEQALTERLESIFEIQLKIVEARGHGVQAPPRDARGMAVARMDVLLDEARHYARQEQYGLALWPCEDAVADIMTGMVLLSAPTASDRIPPDLVAKLAAAGADTPEARSRLATAIGRRYLSSQLLAFGALPLLVELQHRLGDFASALETSGFQVELAHQVADKVEMTSGAFFKPQEGGETALAQALISHAQLLSEVGDGPSLEDAAGHLEEARAILDRAGEEGGLRAQWCLQMGTILQAQGGMEGGMEVVDRGIRACGETALNEPTRRSLEWLRAYFLSREGRFLEAHGLVAGLTSSSALQSYDDSRRDALFHLAAANISAHVGDTATAMERLRSALSLSISADPLDSNTADILMAAADLHRDSSPDLSCDLNLAATAVIDARRAGIRIDALRVGFDESDRRRRMYQELVDRYIRRRRGMNAVTAADRSRARALADLLRDPEWDTLDNQQQNSIPEAPAFDRLTPARALRAAAAFVLERADRAAVRHGSAPPLRADDIKALVREAGRPVLVIQPTGQRVALMLVLPSDRVVTRYSPLGLGETLDLMDSVWGELRIFSTPRGEVKAADHPAGQAEGDGSDRLDRLLSRLWEAVVWPVHTAIEGAKELVISPYREFALLPFALLRTPEGKHIVEDCAVSVVPSLATLAALRSRQRWRRRLPSRAYIAGDPETDPRELLDPLPAARDEARNLGELLGVKGMPEESIALRIGEDATERSFRLEAVGSDLVHLACHGRIEEPASDSRLYFAPSFPYDGMLTLSGIAGVRLRDALVYLSACDTGQGRATADGVIGIGRAFLHAGARAVVLSLWRVQDRAAAVVAGHFYRALLDYERRLTAPAALRAAVLATRDDLRAGRVVLEDGTVLPPHPRYWAPFTILGDAMSVRYWEGEDA